jgi:hypothetical protein
VYTLEPRNGRTFVTTEESYDGLVSRLFRRSLQKTLDKALAEGLTNLKSEAERSMGYTDLPDERAIQRRAAERLTIGSRESGTATARGNITSLPFRTSRRRARGPTPRGRAR